MCTYMCICVHIYTYICICVYMHTYMTKVLIASEASKLIRMAVYSCQLSTFELKQTDYTSSRLEQTAE